MALKTLEALKTELISGYINHLGINNFNCLHSIILSINLWSQLHNHSICDIYCTFRILAA